MPYIFDPPYRTQRSILRGSQGFSYRVASTVWKDGSGWHSQETPDGDTLLAAIRVIPGTGPVTVTDAVAAELIAAGIGVCTLI